MVHRMSLCHLFGWKPDDIWQLDYDAYEQAVRYRDLINEQNTSGG